MGRKMKMVKSLLLGSAAGLVAVAGAQAADLPVKAKPVEYVKICSLYGVGFYYIPGTDMCLKIGGWVRAEYGWGMNGSSTQTYGLNPYLANRATNNDWWRVRGYITADSRNQTEYGTVRGYIALGINVDDLGAGEQQTFNANRAFVQWAGFTFGRAQSYFDFYAGAAVGYLAFYPQSDTGDGGKDVLAYTAQFGNGFSASIAAELPRRTQIIGGTRNIDFVSTLVVGTIVGGGSFVNVGYGGFNAPDIVANLRVDQAWGSAQIAAAAHQVVPLYYSSLVTGLPTAFPEGSGHPDDKWGWAVSGGIKLNAPMIGQGDYFQAQVNYTQGALRYIFQNPGGNPYIQDNQDGVALGIVSDAVYGGTLATGTATDLNLTTAWNVNASYEHFWNPRWRTSVYGGYAEVKYNDQANAILCTLQGFGAGPFNSQGTTALAAAGCDNDWNWWWVGSRTQWNVTKDFYMGLDVAYTRISGYSTPTGFLNTSGIPAGTNTAPRPVNDQDNWQFRFRVHRDFYP
jgi:Porin subfamily